MKKNADKKLNIVYLPVSAIKENVHNARVHTKHQIDLISKSIARYGFNAPILIDKQYILLAGHGRLEAAKKLKLKEVPAIMVPLSGVKAREYLIADNSLAQLAKWEKNILKLELKELQIDIADIGFNIDSIYSDKEKFQSIDPEAIANKLDHTCPKCGFRF